SAALSCIERAARATVRRGGGRQKVAGHADWPGLVRAQPVPRHIAERRVPRVDTLSLREGGVRLGGCRRRRGRDRRRPPRSAPRWGGGTPAPPLRLMVGPP